MFFKKLMNAAAARPVYSGNFPGPTFFSTRSREETLTLELENEKNEDRGYEPVLGLVPVHK